VAFDRVTGSTTMRWAGISGLLWMGGLMDVFACFHLFLMTALADVCGDGVDANPAAATPAAASRSCRPRLDAEAGERGQCW